MKKNEKKVREALFGFIFINISDYDPNEINRKSFKCWLRINVKNCREEF